MTAAERLQQLGRQAGQASEGIARTGWLSALSLEMACYMQRRTLFPETGEEFPFEPLDCAGTDD